VIYTTECGGCGDEMDVSIDITCNGDDAHTTGPAEFWSDAVSPEWEVASDAVCGECGLVTPRAAIFELHYEGIEDAVGKDIADYKDYKQDGYEEE